MISFFGTVRSIMLNCLEDSEIRKTVPVHVALSYSKIILFRHFQSGWAFTTHCVIHIVGGC